MPIDSEVLQSFEDEAARRDPKTTRNNLIASELAKLAKQFDEESKPEPAKAEAA